MRVTLANDIEAEIVTGVPLLDVPLLSYEELTVGPDFDTAERHDKHLVQTYGSDTIQGEDEFRFSTETLFLVSVRLQMPYRALDSGDCFTAWLEKTPEIGLLRLVKNRVWEHDKATHLWYDPQGKFIGCLYEGSEITGEEILRLRIATDVDLLFAQQRLQGWMLTSPLNHLSSEDPSGSEPDEETIALFGRFLRLLVEPDVGRMTVDGDPVILEKLQSLSADLALHPDSSERREVIKSYVDYFLEQFY